MSQWTDNPVLEFQSGEALEQYRRVKLNATTRTIVYADAGEEAIGVTRVAVASGLPVGIMSLHKPGTLPMIASGAITVNTLVYPAVDGKVTSTVTGRAIGRAITSAGADGDQIEVLPLMFSLFHDGMAVTEYRNDFLGGYVTATQGVTAILTDLGTAVVQEEAGGIIDVAASDGTIADNDEAYLHSSFESWLFANNKPLWFEARVALVADTGNVANVIVGLMSAAAANHLQDNGAGPAASYSGAVFYKVDGETAWKAEVSIAGTQTAVTLTSPGRPGSDTHQKLGIEFIPTSSTVATVNFYIDDVLVGSTTTFTYTSATEMDWIVGVKNGDGTTNMTLSVDYVRVAQVR